MFVLQILLLAVGLALLVKGADFFVDGAAGVAGKAKIPELVIGLTVVAFGTSAPEFSVSIQAALQGSTDMSISNVTGSNIFNILFILGVASLVSPIKVNKNCLKFDLPFLMFTTVLFIAVSSIGNGVGRVDGIIMFTCLVLYVIFLIYDALKTRKKQLELGVAFEEEEREEVTGKFNIWYEGMKEKTWFLFVILIAGLAAIVLGARFAVNSATYIAEALNIDERIIGLTVLAIGTSLPELVTSVVAAKKGKADIAVGNVVGSNMFNILCVSGLSAIIVDLPVTAAALTDIYVSLGATVLLCVLSYLKGHSLKRWGGIALLACYVAYNVYLFIGL